MSFVLVLNILSVILGVGLILSGLNDLFHTLFHPAGQGRLSSLVLRAVWRLSRRIHGKPSPTVGPLGIVLVIITWIVIQAVGWALIYLPQMPSGFTYAPGIDPTRYPSFFAALYFSLVTLATLGFGDVVATYPALRILAPLEALTGFVLFTASVSWIMQLYPALNRRRTTALKVRTLMRAGLASRLANGNGEPTDAIILDELATSLAQMRTDLTQNAETYYFTDSDPSLGLPAIMASARRLASTAQQTPNPSVTAASEVLTGAVSDLASLLRDQFLKLDEDDPEAIIEAASKDQTGHGVSSE